MSSFLDGNSAGCVGVPLSPLAAASDSGASRHAPAAAESTSVWVAAGDAGAETIPEPVSGDWVLDAGDWVLDGFRPDWRLLHRVLRAAICDPPEANIRPIGVFHALPFGGGSPVIFMQP